MTEMTRMFSVRPGTPGGSTQKPRTIRSIGTPACEARTSASQTAAVLELVHLGDDPRRPAGLLVLDLPLDHRQEAVAHVDRRDQQLGVVALERTAGQVVEQIDHVAGQRRVAGEQAQVGVEPGRLDVVVAGADVGVAAQAVLVLAHDQRGLGVRLEADDAVDDVDADLLQRLRQLQVLRSSKRAVTSTRQATCLPASAARISASRNGVSAPTR